MCFALEGSSRLDIDSAQFHFLQYPEDLAVLRLELNQWTGTHASSLGRKTINFRGGVFREPGAEVDGLEAKSAVDV